MKKSTFISAVALLVSFAGIMIALAAYFKNRKCVLCDDLDDDLVELYDLDADSGEGDACCKEGDDCCCDSECVCDDCSGKEEEAPKAE